MSGCDIRLVFTFPPKDSTKNAYTSENTFLALLPCFKLLSDIDIRVFLKLKTVCAGKPKVTVLDKVLKGTVVKQVYTLQHTPLNQAFYDYY